MKIAGKRFLCIAMCFLILNFNIQNGILKIYSAEKSAIGISENEESLQTERAVDELGIDKESAKEIANFQVYKAIEEGETTWKSGVKVKKVYDLYDEQKEVCAYAVELKQGSKDVGYVIVGSNEEYSPIIEFKTSGKFLEEKLKNDEYILYNGNIDYYRVNKGTNQATNIASAKESFDLDKLERKGKKSKNFTKEKSSEWKAIRKQVRVGNSTPPTSGGSNTNPGNYESGYTSITQHTAPDAALYTYHAMTELGPGGVCVPTAVCNLLKYYTDRKRLKSSLLLNNSWNSTFNRLKTYFETDVGKAGTFMDDVKPGLDKYFRDINVQDAITHYYGFSKGYDDLTEWTEMKRRIDFGEPFVYATFGSYVYKEHAVLAVGYIQYNYSQTQASGLKESRYLQVADGWEKQANRYINVHVGNNSSYDQMVTLYFVYTNVQK